MRDFIRTISLALAFLSAGTSVNAADLFVDPSTTTPSSSREEVAPAAPSAEQISTDSEQLQAVIENQLSAIRSFDISKAYYAYTTKEFQKTVTLDTFKQFVKKFSVLFRNKQATKDEVAFQGSVAHYKGKFLSVDGELYNVDIILINTEGEWKIQSIALNEAQNPNARQR